MESKKINQLATELAPDLSDLTIIGDPTTGISKKITLSQMASLFTGTVEEYANLAAFPITGVADTIYVAKDTNVIYRWDSTAYVVLSPNVIASLVFNDANGFDGTIALVGSVATLTITTALTSGSVPFIGASGALTQDNANLFFDDTNNRLGINTNAPTTTLDVFGSGIIGRINATSTNNAYLGFSSAGTNKWSVGNVQSDHRFRIYNEATTSELVSVLSTGEFGIGIANPTTKVHIDGGASALIANLDANVSVAKSISFRSDNSNRINLEVSGTESGSNAGADFFLRTYTDLGALIETPLSIVRSTGVTTIKSLTLTNVLSVANGGTGSATQNFVDLTSVQTAAGAKTFSAITSISNATASTSTTTGALIITGGVGIGGALFGTSATFSTTLGVTGISTFSNIVGINGASESGWSLKSNGNLKVEGGSGTTILQINDTATNGRTWSLISAGNGNVHSVAAGSFYLRNSTNSITALTIASTGAASFVSSVKGVSPNINAPSLGSGEGAFFASAANGLYGLYIGTSNDNGHSFIQNTRNDGAATAYNLFIQPNGGNVIIGSTTDNGSKLQITGAGTFSSTIDCNGTLRFRRISFSQINSGASQTVTIISAAGATAFRSLQVVITAFEQTNAAIIQLKFDIIARWSGASLIQSGIGNINGNFCRGFGDFTAYSNLNADIGTSGNSVTLILTNNSAGYINNISVNITENY